MNYDFCIIGGGIVGCATALALQRLAPKARIVLLEKESHVGMHQTSHNSGVIHAGIYYAPGSLKAELCHAGLRATKAFCDAGHIPYDTCGKLIVASDAVELERLEALAQRARDNAVPVQWLNAQQLRAREPYIRGVAALLSPSSAIVDFGVVCHAIARQFEQQGGQLRLHTRVRQLDEAAHSVAITLQASAPQETIHAAQVIVCAGVQADRMVRLAGLACDFHIVPFRGEYYQLPPHWSGLVRHLIYPVPDPSLPFLGIHLTRMIDGSMTVGPNAVLGMAREKPTQFAMDWDDMRDYLGFAGFYQLLWQHRGHAWAELQTALSKRRYLRACQKYCPSLQLSDLQPFRQGHAGIRAQLVQANGELLHDFKWLQTARMLHVCNAPSPAATSALLIGERIAKRSLRVEA